MRFWLFILFVIQCPGAILEWDRNPETNVVAYRVYWGPASRAYNNVLTVTNITATVSNSMMAPGTNYFAVTAVDDGGLESDFSDEVSARRRPMPPTRLVISNVVVLQQSGNLKDWTPVATNLISTSSNASFFRAVGEGEPLPNNPKRLKTTAGSKTGKL